MRLIPRQRHSRRRLRSQITITQEEISADLRYPAAGDRQPVTAYRRIEIK
ncbi:MAG TPA: hypothetical protein VFJ61_09085 [Solirubrobacterales bacterium]|nr:hypothetical protein [Solirubrobacterales bacterium]